MITRQSRDHDREAGGHRENAGEIDQRGVVEELACQRPVRIAADQRADADSEEERPHEPREKDRRLHEIDVLSLRRHDPDQVQRVPAV
jgi:hypothetical protein